MSGFSSTADDFLQLVRESFRDGSFIHLVLSRPFGGATDGEASKLTVRPVIVKAGELLQFTEQIGQQEKHRNLDVPSAAGEIEQRFAHHFRNAHLYTAHADVAAKSSAQGQVKIRKSKPSRKKEQPREHNRAKKYLIPEGKPCAFLHEIGVMTADGQVRKSKYDKFRQINRFLEFVEDVLPSLPPTGTLRIVDFGCGKSYLTFALHHLLVEQHEREVDILGLDLKASVIRECSSIAERLGCRGLRFAIGNIESCEIPHDVHMTVSLHACDTATDAALGKAVAWNSDVILAVPCCQHELAKRIDPKLLPPIQRHGILHEKFASLATDSLRALALEIVGYKTQVVEFIDMDHTAKNLLIRAVKRKSAVGTEKAIAEYRELRSQFGASPIALEVSLGNIFTEAVM